MVNLHFSLLPRWRGAAPVERALLAGDTVTGVCVMAVEEGLDTGGVYARVEVPIGPATTLDELRDELVQVGTQLLVDTLEAGLGEPEPQDGEATYAPQDRPCRAAHRLVAPGRRDRPPGAPRRGVDDVPRRAGEDQRRTARRWRARPDRRAARGQAADVVRGVAQWCPAGVPGNGSSDVESPARLSGAAPDRVRGCVRQPDAGRCARPLRAVTPPTAGSSPTSSTARLACAGRATRSSTAS